MQDSNLRLTDYKSVAVPSEPTGHFKRVAGAGFSGLTVTYTFSGFTNLYSLVVSPERISLRFHPQEYRLAGRLTSSTNSPSVAGVLRLDH